MSTPIRIAVAAAAVLVVAVLGLNFIPRQGGVGGPTLTASPSPTAPPTPSPTSSPSRSPSPTASPRALAQADIGVVLNAGTYRVADPFSVPFAITFSTTTKPNSLALGDVSFSPTSNVGSGYGITVDLVDNVFADPCHSANGPKKPAVPSTVDGVTTALTHMVGFTPGTVSNVVVGSKAGKRVDLTNTIDTATANCSGGLMLPLWTFKGGPATGAATNGLVSLKVWVVDVSGTPVIISADGDAAELTRAQAEIDSIVNTIQFQP